MVRLRWMLSAAWVVASGAAAFGGTVQSLTNPAPEGAEMIRRAPFLIESDIVADF